ncbi:MAG TPA: RNA polymerase sigma factor [Gemmataceae bacterium]|nr:RNA polymerase sigma factor [Gemmataceae bacterium]
MADSPQTRLSLLVRIRDSQDARAWTEFVDVYAPLIHGFLCKQGLQDADAADLTQEVLRAVARTIKHLHYDPARGSFRSWLFTVVRNKLRNFLAKRKRHCQGSGDSDVQELLQQHAAPEEDQAELWEREYERRQFAWAAERVRGEVQESTWEAFRRTAIDGQSGQEAAELLGMSVAAVYLAKSRVMARLKEQIKQCPLE